MLLVLANEPLEEGISSSRLRRGRTKFAIRPSKLPVLIELTLVGAFGVGSVSPNVDHVRWV